MMQIISHRGYWKTAAEKNSDVAFERSFAFNFGTETDFRDFNGELVIAHDVPLGSPVSAMQFFKILDKYNAALPLALNIKADGLQRLLKQLLEKFKIRNYFVFDMSVPDTIGYIENDINFFSRQSEYEPHPVFYDKCRGVWLDAFQDTWYDASLVHRHLHNRKQVAIVSPDLHKRAHMPLWAYIKDQGLHTNDQLLLCTDMPEEALHYFKS